MQINFVSQLLGNLSLCTVKKITIVSLGVASALRFVGCRQDDPFPNINVGVFSNIPLAFLAKHAFFTAVQPFIGAEEGGQTSGRRVEEGAWLKVT